MKRAVSTAILFAVLTVPAAPAQQVLWDTFDLRTGSGTRAAGQPMSAARFTNSNAHPIRLTRVSFVGFPWAGPGSNFKYFRADASGVVQESVVVFHSNIGETYYGADVDWTIPPGEFSIGVMNETGQAEYYFRSMAGPNPPPFHTQSGITGMFNSQYINYETPTYQGCCGLAEMTWRLEGEVLIPPLFNGSFETGSGALGTLPQLSTAMDNWIVTRTDVDWVDTATWQAADGARSVDLQGMGSSGGVGQLATTVAGRRYRLTFSLAGNADGGNPIKHMAVTAGAAGAAFEFDTTGRTPTNMGWVDRSITFVATGAMTPIEFFSTDPPSSWGAAIDHVRLVEEPCPGDLDDNNAIDLGDLAVLLAHFGTPSGATRADGDVDGDGDVDLGDLAVLLANFGLTCA